MRTSSANSAEEHILRCGMPGCNRDEIHTEIERALEAGRNARERVKAKVKNLHALGICDNNGRLIRKDLPNDMRPDSKTEV